MDNAALIRKLHAQRETKCVLEEGLSVTIRRPSEAEVRTLVRGIDLEHVTKHVVNWQGFSEATLLGQGIGSSDALEFDRTLWAEVVADRGEWLAKVAKAILDACESHFEQRKAALGN